DFVNFGYKVGSDPWVASFARNIPGAVGLDWKGRALSSMPGMKGVRAFGPEGGGSLLVVLTASDSITPYIGFVGPTRAKIAAGSDAVMAPDQYGLLDSGQLSGLLTGMKGAAEYELLLSQQAPSAGLGTWLIPGQSFAHLYLIFLIVLGNLGLLF